MQDAFTDLSPISLGTVQLGIAYGVANRVGMPATQTANAILDAALAGGISCLDTSRDYGESEARIGAWLASRPTGARRPLVVTKVPKLPNGAQVGSWVRQQVELSCRTLGVTRLDGVLLRSEQFLLADAQTTLAALRNEGKVGAFGLSVYDPDHLALALDCPGLGAVQVPMNIIDMRCHQRGLLQRCHRQGVAVFVRSAYLQGLLLMAPEHLPAPLAAAAPLLRRLDQLAAAHGLSRAQMALAWVRDVPGVSSVVVGAESVGQIEESLAAAAAPPIAPALAAEILRLVEAAPHWLTDPRTWPKA